MLTLRKINLTEIKNSLKRDEMRMIFGGCGSFSCTATSGCPTGKICCGPSGGPSFCQGCPCGSNCD